MLQQYRIYFGIFILNTHTLGDIPTKNTTTSGNYFYIKFTFMTTPVQNLEILTTLSSLENMQELQNVHSWSYFLSNCAWRHFQQHEFIVHTLYCTVPQWHIWWLAFWSIARPPCCTKSRSSYFPHWHDIQQKAMDEVILTWPCEVGHIQWPLWFNTPTWFMRFSCNNPF